MSAKDHYLIASNERRIKALEDVLSALREDLDDHLAGRFEAAIPIPKFLHSLRQLGYEDAQIERLTGEAPTTVVVNDPTVSADEIENLQPGGLRVPVSTPSE